MALRTADPNPGQAQSDELFNNINDIEKAGTVNKPQDLKPAEEKPEFTNNYTGDNGPKDKQKGAKGFFQKLLAGGKDKGPTAAIITIVIGGGMGFTVLFSPGLLIVQLKEVMVNRFNVQLASMDVRTTKLLSLKTGPTNGLCSGMIKVACKYSTMSAKQLTNFENAGIKVIYDPDNMSLIGRAKPTSFEYDGKVVAASEFSKTLKNDVNFRTAVNRAYNPKFAGFADSFAGKFFAKIGWTKSAKTIAGDTPDEKLKSIQAETDGKNSSADSSGVIDEIDEGDDDPNKDAKKVASEATSEIADEADDLAKAGAKASSVALDTLDALETGAEQVGNTLKITGALDNLCSIYGTVKSIGYAAKTVRALQLAKYALLFYNVADQIKAGVAKPADVAYLGTILTTEYAATKKTATQSFGYNYASTGKIGKRTSISTQFLVGGGLTGKLIGLTSKVDAGLRVGGATPNTTCGTLKNPLFGAVSLVAGIALMLVPGVNLAIGAKDVAQAVGGIAFSYLLSALPALLKDTVAGVLIDKTIVGEASTEASVPGGSYTMGKISSLAPLTPTQKVAYDNLSNDIAAKYAEEDQLAYSPFDATNSNTFLGKFVASLVPYISNMSSLTGTLLSIASISTQSIASISTQNTYAATAADYEMCEDYDYRSIGVATDPYCNIAYGIPVEALNADPVAVANNLYNTGQIDTDGQIIDGSAYETFETDCINRERPLGDVNDNFQGSDGSECLFSDANKDYYLYSVDQRVQNGMDGEDATLSAAQDKGLTDISFYDASLGSADDNTATTTTNNSSTILSNIFDTISNIITPTNSTHIVKPVVESKINKLNNQLNICSLVCDNSTFGFTKNQEYSL